MSVQSHSSDASLIGHGAHARVRGADSSVECNGGFGDSTPGFFHRFATFTKLVGTRSRSLPFGGTSLSSQLTIPWVGASVGLLMLQPCMAN